MSNRFKTASMEQREAPSMEASGVRASIRYLGVWVAALAITFIAVYAALLVEVFLSLPSAAGTALMFTPILATALLLRDSLRRLLFRTLIFVFLINVVINEVSFLVFLFGAAWILRQAWAVENPDGQKFRFSAQYTATVTNISNRLFPLDRKKSSNV